MLMDSNHRAFWVRIYNPALSTAQPNIRIFGTPPENWTPIWALSRPRLTIRREEHSYVVLFVRIELTYLVYKTRPLPLRIKEHLNLYGGQCRIFTYDTVKAKLLPNISWENSKFMTLLSLCHHIARNIWWNSLESNQHLILFRETYSPDIRQFQWRFSLGALRTSYNPDWEKPTTLLWYSVRESNSLLMRVKHQ